MAERVRELDDEEGGRLLRIIRRGSGSVVTWRRAQMILLSAQGMTTGQIAEVPLTSEDRVRDVIHNFNDHGSDSPRSTWTKTRCTGMSRNTRDAPVP